MSYGCDLSVETRTRSLRYAGVIAVAVFGLYGAATSKFDICAKLEESGGYRICCQADLPLSVFLLRHASH